ncbi:trypsin-like [Trichogramma pretiosum]|uniref:trypsin-like n=1 Tax=Trichogramma pretiosum TaxID=7493 RepID=UPI000C71A6B2|nr:trypsin-like [Trichogramma pretiosum]
MPKMKNFIYLSLLVIGVSSFYIDDDPMDKDKIVGGKIAAIKKFPYQAQLVVKDRMLCGAAIISEYWLVTAGHCAFRTQFLLPRKILTGTRYNRRGGHLREIDYIVEHPQYTNETDDNDIALIKLKEPIKFDEKQQPIPLTDRRVKVGDKVLVSGFGWEADNARRTSKQLLKATVYASDLESCRRLYLLTHDTITRNMFCAWAYGRDSCQGDSGGPAVVDGKLAGIVSFGDDCASLVFPGVYTQVHNYLAWIDEVTGEKNKTGVELYNEPNVQKDPKVENEKEIEEMEIPEEGEEMEEYVDVDDSVEDYYDDESTTSTFGSIAKKFFSFFDKLKS